MEFMEQGIYASDVLYSRRDSTPTGSKSEGWGAAVTVSDEEKGESMKSKSVLLTLAAMVIFGGSVSFANSPVHRASGGGTVAQTDLPMESYGFTASIDADGNVQGQAVWQFRPQEARFHGVFTCLHVDGADAWLGGELTKVDVEGFPPLPIYFVWQVRDNGEGGDAAPDQVSALVLSLNPNFPETCLLEPLPPVSELDNGNVMVD
jgi:hypothetical protein